ncbi:uncharacterized protein LOC107048481 isoform X2 [Diachasma alloeum]|uniref:uncharacterized protein LOC107048481 isoform X2 n=1 Tax=Diachasma alloeum TaxID=454923 RepID=UPI0007385115|nr:uncharacterized protein LOC107048481 isoform X2 [Diachasma alloeum]
MKAPEGNSDPWNPNGQAAHLPTYAEAMRAGPPYPTEGPNHPGPHPTQQLPYPTEGPNYTTPYPTQQPPYPTQVPHPTPQIYVPAQDFTDFSQPVSGNQTHQQYQTGAVPVIHHPPTHIQHIVTSAPSRNRSTGILFAVVLALIVIATIIRLNASMR